ncbi:MAG TPA: autotransporter domain-containing protein [Allosphingosinicella sp.]
MPSKSKYSVSTSAKAIATGALPLLAGGAAFLIAGPAAAQSVCVTAPGVVIDCTAPVPGAPPASAAIDLTGSADPITVNLADGFVSNGPVNLGTVGAADINVVSAGTSTIQSTGPGLVATSGRDINAEVTNVSTTGDTATGVLLRAADDIVFTSDGTISTAGADADAVNAQGGSVTLDLTNVSTTGPNAQGIETGAVNGPTVVTVDVVNTSGDGSTGAIIRGTGDNSLSGNAIRTGGTDAAAFDISNDAAACVVLGAGGCDNTVALDEVTTDGFGSTGGLVSSAGTTNVTIGALRTGGDEAAGLSLTADPASCAVLGTGACDTAFTVNQLTTEGARSPGAVVRGAGGIDANVGVLRTAGDEAVGLDLASDPTACAVLGAGGCDTSFSVGELTTSGDGATGLLVRSAGGTSGDVGVLSTQGNDAAGIDIASDPATCILLGAGACDVGLAADSVSTQGDGAAAVLIGGPGAIVADLGRLATGGAGSPGLGITQDPATCVAIGPGSCSVRAAADSVETEGADSPGISIDSPGPVDVVAGPIETSGPGSDGIVVDGGDQPVFVDAGAIVTTGPDSDGIDVTTVNGDIRILAGPVRVSGLGSDAVVAASVCGDIDITARDDLSSAQGSAVVATTGCNAAVTTLPGAAVTGALAGIDVTSGTGATITIGDAVGATAGPAIDADGGAALVAITPTGTVAGRIDLTGNADVLNNAGLFAPAGTSDFGAGVDLLDNSGTIRVNGAATLAGLENLVNRGPVDLADGAPDDTLTVSGNFTGQAGSRLALDVAAGTAGTPADRLVVGGTAGGTTVLDLNLVGGPAVLNPTGTVIVDAGTTAAGAFTLPGGRVRSGFVSFSLGANAAGDTVLLALPNEAAVEPLLLPQLGQTFWYQSADAFSTAAALRRDDLRAAGRRSGLWVQAYGGTEEWGDVRSIDLFGTPTDVDLTHDTFRYGAQAGFDFQGGPGTFGATGGYQRAESNFESSANATLEGYNIGAYFLYGAPRGFYAEALAKVDFFDARIDNGALFDGGDFDGKSYGVELELGYRMPTQSLDIDLGAGLAYVRTDLDGFEASGARFEFDDAESLRGRAGVRVTAASGGARPYADFKVLHEFAGDNRTTFSSGGFDLALQDRGVGTWFRGEVGLTALPGVTGGYLAAWGEAGDVKGYGVRLGLRW